MNDPRKVLREVFGYPSFRPGQEALIGAVLSGRDAAGILPTGAGKSLCYTIPALLLPGTAVVVSPLISLMNDQVRQLERRGIPAACLHSGMDGDTRRKTLRAFRGGALRLLFVSPERLSSRRFREAAARCRISLLAVDEAHCILTWGHDFRPAYRKIPSFLAALPARPVIAAFTATARREDAEEIGRLLLMRSPLIVMTTFDRPNLFYAVSRPAGKLGAALSFLREHRSCAGIVYCGTRRSVTLLSRRLAREGFPNRPYHAGLPVKEREEAQRAFTEGAVPLIVATNAFGMGIHKDDIRFVLHYEMPADPESYYQEAGRAGRDGKRADCLLLSGPDDLRRGRQLLTRSGASVLSERAARDRLRMEAMARYASGAVCLRHFLRSYFGEGSPARCGSCSVCLGQKISPADPEDLARSLQSRLFSLRHDLAREKKIRPDRLFSNRNIREMAEERPRSVVSLLLMEGMPPLAVLRFGNVFLAEIRLFSIYEDAGISRREKESKHCRNNC